MAGWHDTIDTMLALRGFWTSHAGRHYGDALVQSVASVDAEMSRGKEMEPGWMQRVATMQIDLAEPFFVSPDVFDLVERAAETFQPEPFQRTDLITERGFVVLPRPFYSQDKGGNTIATVAFSWGPAQTGPTNGASAPALGTYLLLYSDMTDGNDSYVQRREVNIEQIRETFGPVAVRYSLWHFSPWWFGSTAPKVEEHVKTMGDLSSPSLWIWLQAFFRLSMQQLVTADMSIPPRPYARRAKRAGRDPGVLVMKLRRRSQKVYGEDGGEPIERDFQWLVRGHWRNQWYESLGEHRQIWIAPYVKGPEGKPFKTPDLRVFTFNR